MTMNLDSERIITVATFEVFENSCDRDIGSISWSRSNKHIIYSTSAYLDEAHLFGEAYFIVFDLPDGI